MIGTKSCYRQRVVFARMSERGLRTMRRPGSEEACVRRGGRGGRERDKTGALERDERERRRNEVREDHAHGVCACLQVKTSSRYSRARARTRCARCARTAKRGTTTSVA